MNGDKHWTENFRIFTPILVTIACFMLGHLISTTNKIDDKLFKHLTNDEVHCPRSLVITRPEFSMYQEMRNKEMSDLKDGIFDIKRLLIKGYGNGRK